MSVKIGISGSIVAVAMAFGLANSAQAQDNPFAIESSDKFQKSLVLKPGDLALMAQVATIAGQPAYADLLAQGAEKLSSEINMCSEALNSAIKEGIPPSEGIINSSRDPLTCADSIRASSMLIEIALTPQF